MVSRFAPLLLAPALACSVSQADPSAEDTSEGGSTLQTTGDDEDEAPEDSGDSSSTGVPEGSTGSDESTGEGTTTGAAETTGSDDGDTIPSSGCDGTPLSPGAHADLAIAHGGLDRSYDVFVPPAHDGTTPLPLVINLHGWTVTPAGQAAFSQMNVTAADRGFSVAYPAGVEESWNATLCCGAAHSGGLDDVGFVRAVVDDLDGKLCFDRRRVYAAGHSNGAFLSHELACGAADVFAAVGSVAGTLPIAPETCNPARPIAVAQLHGTGDPIVSYEGGGLIGHPSAPDSAAGWAARNGCDPESSVAVQSRDLTCHVWQGCNDDVEVRLCAFAGMGHCWPGNPDCSQGPPSTTHHGSELLADFFEAHTMP